VKGISILGFDQESKKSHLIEKQSTQEIH